MDLDLTRPDHLIPLLQKYGLFTQKNFGQHFLIDHGILQAILQAADIHGDDTIVEVGAGTGVLTRELAAQARRVITFEIDAHLNQLLAETLADCHNVELHFQDFLAANLAEVLKPPSTTRNSIPDYKFVANLPYNAGSHILGILLKSPRPPLSVTVLLQKEVAHKIVAQPPHATYLSNFFQLYGHAQVIKNVPPGAFFPAPAVHSAILHVEREELVSGRPGVNPITFSHFLHRGFATPRKMINKPFTSQELESAHIDPQQRPENLALVDWLNLYQVIQSKQGG